MKLKVRIKTERWSKWRDADVVEIEIEGKFVALYPGTGMALGSTRLCFVIKDDDKAVVPIEEGNLLSALEKSVDLEIEKKMATGNPSTDRRRRRDARAMRRGGLVVDFDDETLINEIERDLEKGRRS